MYHRALLSFPAAEELHGHHDAFCRQAQLTWRQRQSVVASSCSRDQVAAFQLRELAHPCKLQIDGSEVCHSQTHVLCGTECSNKHAPLRQVSYNCAVSLSGCKRKASQWSETNAEGAPSDIITDDPRTCRARHIYNTLRCGRLHFSHAQVMVSAKVTLHGAASWICKNRVGKRSVK